MNSIGDSSASSDRARVLILAGTTASGKTEVSIPLAEELDGVILNADSRQVYNELLIGTARPTDEQLARVRHEFVATRSIHDRWTAGDFARECRMKIDEVMLEGKLPLIVGGSMLYLRALMDGFYETDAEPEIDYVPLREEWDRRGSEEMYNELCAIDPETAARTQREDHHRILRALGVYRALGETLSGLQARKCAGLGHPFRLYFLHGDRAETYARVNLRVDAMLEEGLVDEVRGLFGAGTDEKNCRALQTHGYQEVFPFLRGEIDFATMRENIRKAVRHYVKRQLTWFRAEPRATWVFRDFTESPESVAMRIADDFRNTKPA
ncbi:tRNA (adenosine(37)-N6)-dimethylallyltransferase MiaA [bacterium]|nr:tRNA (adenosine(37)-N6)-dimethylallyltransferase MiaA [bacterium]